jgi:hypothetical protein
MRNAVLTLVSAIAVMAPAASAALVDGVFDTTTMAAARTTPAPSPSTQVGRRPFHTSNGSNRDGLMTVTGDGGGKVVVALGLFR